MTDRTSCTIYPAGTALQAYPFVTVYPDHISVTAAGADAYPGRMSFIRVDSHKALTAGGTRFDKWSVEAFLSQLQTAKSIRTRFSEWPSGLDREDVAEPEGLRQALTYCRSRFSGA